MKIRTMTAADIPAAMRLKAQNNWNQLEADWQRQLDLEPASCFVAECGNAGEVAGTACACVFGDVAWINMVLVDQARRGQGIGTALMKHVVEHLDGRAVGTIRLDATPLGQVVYEKLGFTGEFALERFAGIFPERNQDTILPAPRVSAREGVRIQPPPPDAVGQVAPLTPADLPAAAALDLAVTGTRRDKLLQRLYDASPRTALKYVRAGELKGYCLCRPGANAWQIGPLQGSVGAGLYLLAELARRLAGQPIYIDVPRAHEVAITIAQSLGLKLQRSFLRMNRGKRLSEAEHLHLFWASFGPEKG